MISRRRPELYKLVSSFYSLPPFFHLILLYASLRLDLSVKGHLTKMLVIFHQFKAGRGILFRFLGGVPVK